MCLLRASRSKKQTNRHNWLHFFLAANHALCWGVQPWTGHQDSCLYCVHGESLQHLYCGWIHIHIVKQGHFNNNELLDNFFFFWLKWNELNRFVSFVWYLLRPGYSRQHCHVSGSCVVLVTWIPSVRLNEMIENIGFSKSWITGSVLLG